MGTSTAVLGAIAALLGSAATAVASPDYDVPFPCGQEWFGSTRDGHSPSRWAIDFNRADDFRDLVVASGPGRVAAVDASSDSGYGKHVVVDHGAGYSTLHAHLDAVLVFPGATLDLGDPVGLVGETGNAYGTHLHYEQRLDRTVQSAVFGGEPFGYGSAIASANCPTVPIAGDWNGNGRADVGSFKRAQQTGRFKLRMPNADLTTFDYGRSADTPIVGDWDGNGRSDTGTWRQAKRTFRLRLADGTTRVITFGRRRDRPVAGDWNSDGAADVGVWRPSTATFRLRRPNGLATVHQVGTPDDIPLSGDWDGDGRWDVGVFDHGSSTFTLRKSDGSLTRRFFGQPADLPVTGDWNGDGQTDVGVWTPSTGTFSLRYSAQRVEHLRFGAIR